ncbi:hypothetical protein QFC20_007425 [Naganishia adeliensis]|uniref:Uncharacterized protein n=1 Tax=Naganishia adeliensis TaxID=92952 RepID=A0ACC2V055_9TREE|nr:hypothetical protein QFC20_007425 [Naganishia adeliensis]
MFKYATAKRFLDAARNHLEETPEIWDGVKREEAREAIANVREELKRAGDLVRRGQACEWGKEDLSQTGDLF